MFLHKRQEPGIDIEDTKTIKAFDVPAVSWINATKYTQNRVGVFLFDLRIPIVVSRVLHSTYVITCCWFSLVTDRVKRSTASATAFWT